MVNNNINKTEVEALAQRILAGEVPAEVQFLSDADQRIAHRMSKEDWEWADKNWDAIEDLHTLPEEKNYLVGLTNSWADLDKVFEDEDGEEDM